MTKKNRGVPKGFQLLNDLFNMGKLRWQTGKNKVEPDAELELLNDDFNKHKKCNKSRKPRMK